MRIIVYLEREAHTDFGSSVAQESKVWSRRRGTLYGPYAFGPMDFFFQEEEAQAEEGQEGQGPLLLGCKGGTTHTCRERNDFNTFEVIISCS